MEIFLIACLTVLFFFSILVTMHKKQKSMKHTITKQSDMHNALKLFFSRQENGKEKISQTTKRSDENKFEAIIVDERAYWVIDNVFWTAKVKNGRPNMSEAEPVDVYNMPKKELDKMLFILDNLGGRNNERGSTGN